MEKEEITSAVNSKQDIPQNITDSALLHLVNLANHEISIGVTLFLQGTVIYGDLMSGYEYCQQTASNIRSGGGDSGTEVRELTASFYDELAKDYKTGGDNVIPLNFLHLKNPAHLRGDGSRMAVNGGLFRVAIDKVSGFSVGKPSY